MRAAKAAACRPHIAELFANACEQGAAHGRHRLPKPARVHCESVRCPAGSACAPVPCPNPNAEGSGAVCAPVFQCTAQGAGIALRRAPQQCGCPNGQFCSDCGPCKTCNNGQCSFITACSGGGEESVAECASQNAAACCPSGQTFDPIEQHLRGQRRLRSCVRRRRILRGRQVLPAGN